LWTGLLRTAPRAQISMLTLTNIAFFCTLLKLRPYQSKSQMVVETIASFFLFMDYILLYGLLPTVPTSEYSHIAIALSVFSITVVVANCSTVVYELILLVKKLQEALPAALRQVKGAIRRSMGPANSANIELEMNDGDGVPQEMQFNPRPIMATDLPQIIDKPIAPNLISISPQSLTNPAVVEVIKPLAQRIAPENSRVAEVTPQSQILPDTVAVDLAAQGIHFASSPQREPSATLASPVEPSTSPPEHKKRHHHHHHHHHRSSRHLDQSHSHKTQEIPRDKISKVHQHSRSRRLVNDED